ETELAVEGFDDAFHGVFIRSPVVERIGPDVEVLAEVEGRPVLCRQGNVLVASFHPELAGDVRIHRRFLEAAFASDAT
ncbi:MAG: pyridoxal 5'-phosphate synthase glutaminase subunit PdxT, partial [Acidimicrobiales bacterium]|nr:pyridoxal 5'-phosphate synthase glutaminase subunit PdxT [Acidimicrobiales bacterium]